VFSVLFVLIEFLENLLKEPVDILQFVVLAIVHLQKEIECFLIDVRVVHSEDGRNEVIVKFELVHLHLPPVLDLLYHVDWGQIFILFVDLDYQVFD
jgi:hypothetical protein